MHLHKDLKYYGIKQSQMLFGGILFINILQSFFTPLLNDEPYYWLYSKYPAWGYFDHPPMIAWLIKSGNIFFNGEIGVRLFTAVLGSFTFYFVYKIIEAESAPPVNFKLACILLFSSVFLNLYSFLAIPDTPMLFFAVLFLFHYRNYLAKESIANSIILGVVTALLLYSKYHGVLLVGFTVLSNYRLIFKRSFYIVLSVALLLYLPHINWQLQNDYPTIRFQFFDRANEFNIQHVISYVSEQAGITGPIILLLFSFLYQPKNLFQKSLQFNIAGIFIFFLISSFKEMVNIHWTAIAWPCLLCLAYLYIAELHDRKRKLVTALLLVDLVIVVILRLNFVAGTFRIPNFNDKNPELMASVLRDATGGAPLVFKDMYNEPAYYSFYGNRPCFAVNTIWYKKTEFNYLPQLEQSFQGKTVNLISADPLTTASRKITIPQGKSYYVTNVPHFASYGSGVKIKANNFGKIRALAENHLQLVIESSLTATGIKLLEENKPVLLLTLINDQTKQSFSFTYNKMFNVADKASFDFSFKAPGVKGNYKGVFSLVSGNNQGLPGFDSNIYNCQIQ